MNIKQAEQLSGVSKRNIRFYKQAGLLCPKRNQENDYREYSNDDITKLKLIRTLRMVDMPLDQIKEILDGTLTINEAAKTQRNRLQLQVEQLSIAISFCEEFSALSDINELNIDDILNRMEEPNNKVGLFKQWIYDYKKIAKTQSYKVFTFMPDIAVTNPKEFTTALFQYANDNDLNLVITKESMYPEFTIDGIEYTAVRYYAPAYHMPVAVIRCTAVHPEDFASDVPKSKKVLLKLLYFSWLPLFFLLINLDAFTTTDWSFLFSNWYGWLIIISLLVVIGTMVYYFYFLFIFTISSTFILPARVIKS